MNYLSKIDDIIEALKKENELAASNEMQELKRSVSTGSELLMSIAFRLKQLVKSNTNISRSIREDVAQLLNYCESIGLTIDE